MPPAAVDALAVRHGLLPEAHRKVRARCDGCERETELVISRGGYVTCSECGTVRRWTVLG